MKSWNIFLRTVRLGAHRLPRRVSRLELQMAPTTVRDHGCTWSFLLLFGVGVLLLLQIIYECSGYLKPCSRLHFPPLSRLHSLLTHKSSEIIPALKTYSVLCTNLSMSLEGLRGGLLRTGHAAEDKKFRERTGVERWRGAYRRQNSIRAEKP